MHVGKGSIGGGPIVAREVAVRPGVREAPQGGAARLVRVQHEPRGAVSTQVASVKWVEYERDDKRVTSKGRSILLTTMEPVRLRRAILRIDEENIVVLCK